MQRHQVDAMHGNLQQQVISVIKWMQYVSALTPSKNAGCKVGAMSCYRQCQVILLTMLVQSTAGLTPAATVCY